MTKIQVHCIGFSSSGWHVPQTSVDHRTCPTLTGNREPGTAN